MNYPDDLDSGWERPVDYQHLFKTRNSKHSKGSQPGMLKAEGPTHLGLRREQREGFVRSHEKTVAGFRAGFGRKIVGLPIEVAVCLRAKDIPGVHCPLAPRRRSSSIRCFASQYPGPI